MRDSNYRSISNNRAAVTITTSLYDRRALDVTSDKPLVNSLNHLTYLVSSSAKVRETLSNDGGIERLVEILLECHNSNPSSNNSIFNNEKKLLTAWKWTLAFQCLVLISTRGTEKIRQKVVRAGMLPVIATVLDNYMSLHETNSVGKSVPFVVGASQMYPNLAVQQFTQQMQESRQAAQDDQLGEQALAQDTHADIRLLQNQGNDHLTQQANNLESIEDDQRDTFMSIQFPTNQAAAQTGEFSETAVPTTANQNTTQFEDEAMMQPIDYLSSNDARSAPSGYRKEVCDLFYVTHDIDNLLCEDLQNLSLDQLLKLVRGDVAALPVDSREAPKHGISEEIRRRLLIVTIIRKLREEKENEVTYNHGQSDSEYDMDNNLQFLSNLYLFDEASTSSFDAIHSKITPRNFTNTGLIIPRDDDVVWCLQLLAYISKYPYLKDVLQNTHLVTDMSMRDREMRLAYRKQLRTKAGHQLSMNTNDLLVSKEKKADNLDSRFIPSAPDGHEVTNFIEGFHSASVNSPQLNALDLQHDNFDLSGDELELCGNSSELKKSTRADEYDDDLEELEEDSDDKNKDDEDVDEYLPAFEDNSINPRSSSYLYYLRDQIRKAKLKASELDRDLTLYRLNEQVNEFISVECKSLSNIIIEKRLEEKSHLSKVWNYDTYSNFDIDNDDPRADEDFDEALREYKKVNLFPMIEKFTFLAGTDMSYWSGVIMRNSCRRNDFKGGVRQCGNLECGRWEKFPREFSKCKRCKRTKYCSRECQMRAWHSHKNWCVPSNSSTSTNTTQSANFENQNERAGNVSSGPSDAEGGAPNAGAASQVNADSDPQT